MPGCLWDIYDRDFCTDCTRKDAQIEELEGRLYKASLEWQQRAVEIEELQKQIDDIRAAIQQNAESMREVAAHYTDQSKEAEAAVEIAINRDARVARAAAAIELNGMAFGFRLTADWLEALAKQKDKNHGNDERNVGNSERRAEKESASLPIG